MAELTGIGIISAFVAGIISFLSPCVLPLVPGYVSYIAGGTLEDLTNEDGFSRRRMAALTLSGFFVLGFTIVFVALGASASAVGDFLLHYKTEFEYGAGAVIIIFGFYLTGHPLNRHRSDLVRFATTQIKDLASMEDGAKVVIDEASLPFLEGSALDYVDELIGASFKIHNPNATAACGCGTSFSVEATLPVAAVPYSPPS